MTSLSVITQMKAAEQYFPVVLFVTLYKVVLTFESEDEILWCDHSNETLLAVLSHGTIYIWVFYKKRFGNCLEFSFWALPGVKGLRNNNAFCLTRTLHVMSSAVVFTSFHRKAEVLLQTFSYDYRGWRFSKTIIPHPLVGYELVLTNSALRAWMCIFSLNLILHTLAK